MSKQQSAGAIVLTQRVEALEKLQVENAKRIDALEKHNEHLNHLNKSVDIPRETYSAQFDRWPNAR